jgi:hypothetical protein
MIFRHEITIVPYPGAHCFTSTFYRHGFLLLLAMATAFHIPMTNGRRGSYDGRTTPQENIG